MFLVPGFGKARLSVAHKAANDYRKIYRNLVASVDMMLFYVEQGVKFTDAYGDIDEPFYCRMESMFASATKAIDQYGLFDLTPCQISEIDEFFLHPPIASRHCLPPDYEKGVIDSSQICLQEILI